MRKLHLPRAPGASPRRTWLIGVVTFVLLSCGAAWQTHPPLPRTIRLQIVFAEGTAGKTEPLITAGVFEAADFVDVRYDGPTTARFGYDYWGQGGPVSEPFPFVPGRTYPLEIEMPALGETGSIPPRHRAPFRAVLDGREVLRADVLFHRRGPSELYFGENPIGGNTAGAEFRGKLLTPGGREVRGGPDSYFSSGTQFVAWLLASPLLVLVFAGISAGVAFGAPWFLIWCGAKPAHAPSTTAHASPHHRWFAGAALACALVFTWVLTGGGWALNYAESFSNFYDYQAQSLLHGRLDVPDVAIEGEAFIYKGKTYGYFGPTPAILRLPFAILGVGFGHLSRMFLLIDYVAALIGAYFLLWHATRTVGGPDKYPSRFATVMFTAAVGLGSTLFFVASRAYVYHEAIICGVAFAIWSAYFSLRFLAAPESRWWLGALLCGTAAVHARPPIGFFALSLLGIVAATQLGRSLFARQSWRKPLAIGVLATLAIASYNGVSYLKFETVDGCPLRYNVQYIKTPDRLAKIDGRQFHLSNVPYSLDAYFRKNTLGVNGNFPYFYPRGFDSDGYPGAKMDMLEPMAGVPYAMPALFALAVFGFLGAVLPGSALRPPLMMLLLAAIPMALALFAAIAVSHRYTADFLGFFVATAALGFAWVDFGVERWRTIARVVIVILALAATAITLGLTLNFQNTIVWGTPKETLEHYQRLRDRVEHATRGL